jgi:hypothetical protein
MQNKIKMKPLTSNIELIDLCKRYNVPLNAVIYKNELLKYDPNKTRSFIIDLHDSSDQSTGHWISLFKSEIDNKWVYFDPFGIIYPIVVKKFCGEDIEWNNEQIQSYYSGYCGYYCFIFLFYMSRGYDLKFIQDQFNQFD